jgi:hypothetical protein
MSLRLAPNGLPTLVLRPRRFDPADYDFVGFLGGDGIAIVNEDGQLVAAAQPGDTFVTDPMITVSRPETAAASKPEPRTPPPPGADRARAR